MRIAVYGGSFNPPHLGHMEAALSVYRELAPDIFLIIPDNIPPHKDMDAGSPTAEQRRELCALAFRDVPGALISDIELRREGKSYSADTIAALREQYPLDELLLVMGSDMLLSFEEWYRYEYLLMECTLTVLSREDDDEEALRGCAERFWREYGARVRLLPHAPLPMSSSDIRRRLRLRQGAELLDDEVYSLIVRNGYYEALPELSWLREKSYEHLSPERIGHVAGCESEAVMLAKQWGEDQEAAATAGILHDITKKLNLDEQLILCKKYGIICDKAELANPKLLHAKTGAALSRDLFGISDEIYDAICRHTTGKPDMTALEKIIYLADYIEPTRDFPGLEALRALAYEDLDAAMALGLKMRLEDIRGHGIEPYIDTVEAYSWYSGGRTEEEKC